MTTYEALRAVIQAIENGQRVDDHRGVVYQQQFGIAFVTNLKKALDDGTLSKDGG